MPNIPPQRPSRQVPSGERLKQLLTASMTKSMPNTGMDSAPPASFREAALRDYPYNPSDYRPEELARYEDMLFRNSYGNPFPSNTGMTGEDLIGSGLYGEGIRKDPRYARQDSLYTAQRLENAKASQRSAIINDLMEKLGSIPGLQVRKDR